MFNDGLRHISPNVKPKPSRIGGNRRPSQSRGLDGAVGMEKLRNASIKSPSSLRKQRDMQLAKHYITDVWNQLINTMEERDKLKLETKEYFRTVSILSKELKDQQEQVDSLREQLIQAIQNNTRIQEKFVDLSSVESLSARVQGIRMKAKEAEQQSEFANECLIHANQTLKKLKAEYEAEKLASEQKIAIISGEKSLIQQRLNLQSEENDRLNEEIRTLRMGMSQ